QQIRKLPELGMRRDLTHTSDRVAYYELSGYTLMHRDPAFIHQHVVDAFAAQNADERIKPITLTFALVGLHLHVEQRFTGKEVQRAHQLLVRHKRPWPSFTLPRDRGSMTAAHVAALPMGTGRDQAIHAWCACVWEAFHDCHPTVTELLRSYGHAFANRGRFS
ncbi:MAG: hypothetical protein JWQ04_3064, partial [Pedosphaera sp.]|nr:hypothetical protein [Pedosphaera sp.]